MKQSEKNLGKPAFKLDGQQDLTHRVDIFAAFARFD